MDLSEIVKQARVACISEEENVGMFTEYVKSTDKSTDLRKVILHILTIKKGYKFFLNNNI